MDAIAAIADKYGLFIVEDAQALAHAIKGNMRAHLDWPQICFFRLKSLAA